MTTLLAPMINSRLSERSPIFVVAGNKIMSAYRCQVLWQS
ncbi:hypothetical protein RUE5091_00070 [Ruegeria denitrificans]|uniref:Uncharacterized protein n=1 Tax=Ruegeria denitrificans TaxID=1715692 RepID=A0A0P1I0L7_9RHOB|nr:hypothetical protein RUE5091_00070 [Ruegeria denitrificans]